MLIKMDIAKAYDKLNWYFMRCMLEAFGFWAEWIEGIMHLTTSTFYSILINGVPSGTFQPSRGMRQGDPLSPFLFILMAEGLGQALSHARENEELRGIKVHPEVKNHTHQ